MNQAVRGFAMDEQGDLPHTRGDEPACGSASVEAYGNLPHTRGDEPRHALVDVRLAVYLPHTRGDEPSIYNHVKRLRR